MAQCPPLNTLLLVPTYGWINKSRPIHRARAVAYVLPGYSTVGSVYDVINFSFDNEL